MLASLALPEFTIQWDEIVRSLAILSIAVLAAYLVHRVVFSFMSRIARLTRTSVDDTILVHMRSPIAWVFIEIAISIAAQTDRHIANAWEAVDAFAIPAILGWLALSLVRAVAAGLDRRTDESMDPVAARSRKTRISLFSRTIGIIIIIITVGLMLLGVPGVRDVGTTLLASAGLAALAVGAAAQPALKSLIAGLQMAITEPLRLGDMVVVDGHTGRVEEIRMSFVTVRTWDERVIVVPTLRFLDESFENWSRRSEELTGPVFLHLDPIAEIEPIRAEFTRFTETQELWDKRSAALLMTEAHPESIELRLSVSAATIGDLFALRCAIREHMLAWLKTHQPEALIRHRLEVEAANERAKF
ncbi:putative MscS family protein [Alteripontixanthobacter maritimus]|uniref:Putative MscS family protein n=1 Tax=Alteripontixanthobacter maritimus TaxID=2161824 RepID=A0A369QBJ7_9SPHN|nr:mechanosensitive ion channel domain-containing protein [Alteripontixanthobacter maritimus]RDC60945.1 putative MscS family protein [Alteripontixanthobacter maritimus]